MKTDLQIINERKGKVSNRKCVACKSKKDRVVYKREDGTWFFYCTEFGCGKMSVVRLDIST